MHCLLLIQSHDAEITYHGYFYICLYHHNDRSYPVNALEMVYGSDVQRHTDQ